MYKILSAKYLRLNTKHTVCSMMSQQFNNHGNYISPAMVSSYSLNIIHAIEEDQCVSQQIQMCAKIGCGNDSMESQVISAIFRRGKP